MTTMALVLVRCSVLGLVLVSGCSDGGSGGPAPDQAECLVGVWLKQGSCPDCLPGLDTPECMYGDCMLARVRVLDEAGSRWEYEVRMSEEAGSLSVVPGCSGITEGRWILGPEGRVELQDSDGSPLSSYAAGCTDGRHGEETEPWFRAGSDLARQLEALPTADECVGVPWSGR